MGKKILIVEDEPGHLRLTRDVLERHGYEVVSAINGLDGFLQCQKMKPDAAILDLMLPGLDGYEICSRLRGNSQYDHMPIIILSAKAREHDKNMAIEVGANAYLTKPADPLKIVQQVEELLLAAEA